MLAEYLANLFFSEGIISDEDQEIVRFGLKSMEVNLLGIALTLAVGTYFNHISEAVLLWLLLFPLRKNAGGFHATTPARCLIISAEMLVISFILFTTFKHTMIFYGICVIITGCIIWILVPIDNPSKELDMVERKVYRIRSRVVLCVEGIIFLLAMYFKCEIAARSISMTFFIVTMSLLLGVIKLEERNIK